MRTTKLITQSRDSLCAEDEPVRLSDAEWTIMRVLWTRPPASARDVLETIGPGESWAYSTVKTMLARLAEKGAVRVRMRGNTSLYAPILSREKARRSAVRLLIDRAFDGAFGPLLHILINDSRLSAEELAQVRELVGGEARRGNRS